MCVKADLFMKQVNHSLGLGLGLYSSSCLILQFSQACFQLQLTLFSLLSCLLLALKPITLRLEEGKEKGKAGRQQFKMSRLLLYSKETVPFSCSPPLTIFLAFSSLAWAFICWTSMVSSLLRRMYKSWLPIHNCIICNQRDSTSLIGNW